MAYAFTYIPATQDGFTLQEKDALTHTLIEMRARKDARTLVSTLYEDFNLDDALDFARSEGEGETYCWAFTMEAEKYIEKLHIRI